MDPVFKKLNYKDEDRICVLSPPVEFKSHLSAIEEMCQVDQSVSYPSYLFILGFIQSEAELKAMADKVSGHFEGDVKLWIAYPKKSSKKYNAEINRDSNWQILGDLGFEPVRQVAIDEDWSALRFRKTDYIKSMKRTHLRAISEKGKKRTG